MKKRSAKTNIMTVTNAQDASGRPETLALLSDIRSLIDAARMRVSTAANVEMVLLYWHIGERIRKDILGMERADYGKQIVQTLSGKLISEYGRGYSRTNLFYMIRFAEVFSDLKIVQTLAGQLGWSHFVQIIAFDDPLKRIFMQKCAGSNTGAPAPCMPKSRACSMSEPPSQKSLRTS